MPRPRTLDEWIRLTSDERNRLRRRWQPDSGYWQQLLQEAQERFSEKYGGHRLINHIAWGDWSPWYANYEPAIFVTTALYTPQIIEQLPDRFATFAVRQWPVLDNKQWYLKVWKQVLRHLLGWGASRVRRWARDKWEDGLDGKDGGIFYHEPPCWYLTALLIPERIQRDLDPIVRTKLESRLQGAIERSGADPSSDPDYDWEAARSRVNAVLAEFGESIPPLRNSYE